MAKDDKQPGLRNLSVSRNYILLLVAIFAAELGYGIVIPAIQLYAANTLHASVGLIGIAIAAFPFTNTFFKIFGGSLADRFGRRLMIVIGLAISTVSPLLMSLITIPWMVWLYIPIRAMDGTGNSVIWPAANAMVADMMARQRRDTALGILNLSFAIGTGVGPAIGLYIMDWSGGAKASFLTASVMIGATTLLVLFFMKETLRRRRKPAESTEAKDEIEEEITEKKHPLHDWLTELKTALGSLVKNKRLMALSLQGFLNMFIVGINTSVLVLYANNVLGMEKSQTAFGFLFLSIATIALVYPAGRFAERLGRKNLMIWGMLITSAALVMIPFITRPGFYYTMMIMAGVGVALILPSWMSLSVENIPTKGRATVLGGVGTITSFGLVMGPLIASFLYEHLSPVSPFYFAGAIIAANAILIAFVFRDHQEKPQQDKTERRLPYYIDQ